MNFSNNLYSLDLANRCDDINLFELMTSQVDCKLCILSFEKHKGIATGCLFFEAVFCHFA